MPARRRRSGTLLIAEFDAIVLILQIGHRLPGLPTPVYPSLDRFAAWFDPQFDPPPMTARRAMALVREVDRRRGFIDHDQIVRVILHLIAAPDGSWLAELARHSTESPNASVSIDSPMTWRDVHVRRWDGAGVDCDLVE